MVYLRKLFKLIIFFNLDYFKFCYIRYMFLFLFFWKLGVYGFFVSNRVCVWLECDMVAFLFVIFFEGEYGWDKNILGIF